MDEWSDLRLYIIVHESGIDIFAVGVTVSTWFTPLVNILKHLYIYFKTVN